MTSYDPNNIFAKILRGEVPAHKVYEDETHLRLSRHHAAGGGTHFGDPQGRGAQHSRCSTGRSRQSHRGDTEDRPNGDAGLCRRRRQHFSIQRAGGRADRVSPALPRHPAETRRAAQAAGKLQGRCRGAVGSGTQTRSRAERSPSSPARAKPARSRRAPGAPPCRADCHRARSSASAGAFRAPDPQASGHSAPARSARAH